LPTGQPFDFIFLDADHSQDEVRRELRFIDLRPKESSYGTTTAIRSGQARSIACPRCWPNTRMICPSSLCAEQPSPSTARL
jgi:hypothetical protein